MRNEAIFESIKASILALNISALDVIFFMSQCNGSSPQLSSAFGLHVIDIQMGDSPEKETWPRTMAEAYRRCFFDPDYVAIYGTEYYAERANLLQAMADGLVLWIKENGRKTPAEAYVQDGNKSMH